MNHMIMYFSIAQIINYLRTQSIYGDEKSDLKKIHSIDFTRQKKGKILQGGGG